MLCLGPTSARARKHLAREFGNPHGDPGGTTVWTDTSVGVFLGVDCLSVNTLAHEGLHVVGRIMQMIGHGYSFAKDEPHAYLLGWVVNWMWWCVDSAKAPIQVSQP